MYGGQKERHIATVFVFGNGGGTIGINLTRFLAGFDGTSVAADSYRVVMPRSGTLKKLSMKALPASTINGVGHSVEVLINGASAPTPLMVTWNSPPPGTPPYAPPTATTASVAAGDVVSVRLKTNGTAGTLSRPTVSFELEVEDDYPNPWDYDPVSKVISYSSGSIRIADGTEGAGKVLTSDASGLASWSTLPAGTAPTSAPSPLQIATLRWYEAADPALATFPTGPSGTSAPSALAFDGANMWVAHTFAAISKLRPSDGAVLALHDPGGYLPSALAFDGSNIWVANRGDLDNRGRLSKLRASDGALLGIFECGLFPRYLAFDGTHIWAAHQGHFLTKFRARDGAPLGTFPSGGADPSGLLFDGANLWVVHSTSQDVCKVRPSDGTVLGVFPAGGLQPCGITFDGSHIWVAHHGSGTVSKLGRSDGVIAGTFPAGRDHPHVLAFDGANIWIAHADGPAVSKLRASDGALLGTFTWGGALDTRPNALAFDGLNMWVAVSEPNIVMKL